MASMSYVSIPPTATRLQNKPASMQPVKRTFTALPAPSPSPAPFSSPSSSLNLTSPTNAAFSLLPQMLLSSTLPGLDSKPGVKDRLNKGAPSLLTTRDPLSLPTMSTNFRRFVARSGPIFWFQDRVEEILFWRRGWRATSVWIAVYAFICYFPRMIFLLPHAILIAVLLASYPYPDPKSPSAPPPSPGLPATESVNWQANIQGIQNLMGFVADTYDLIQPYTQHLVLTPAHVPSLSSPPLPTSKPSNAPPPSPYVPYILLSLVISLPPLLLIISSPLFPARFVCFLVGVLPVFISHPLVLPIFLQLSQNTDFWIRVSQYILDSLMETKMNVRRRWAHTRSVILRRLHLRWRTGTRPDEESEEDFEEVETIPVITLLERFLDDDRLDDRCWLSEMREVELWENQRFLRAPGASGHRRTTSLDMANSNLNPSPAANMTGGGSVTPSTPGTSTTTTTYSTPLSATPAPAASPAPYAAVRRFSLSQALLPIVMQGSVTPTLAGRSPAPGLGPGTWSKANLRPGERKGWTRGRDGWGGVRPSAGPGVRREGTKDRDKLAPRCDDMASGAHMHVDDYEETHDENTEGGAKEEAANSEGFVSSNLTFSLAPGWSFVKTEGWRRDRLGKWAGIECTDGSGWVYTNDTWSVPRSIPDAGSVTRRRRWARRIWFDGSSLSMEGQASGVDR